MQQRLMTLLGLLRVSNPAVLSFPDRVPKHAHLNVGKLPE
jgi:hypothetical protein